MTVKRVTLVMLTVIWGAMMLSMTTEDLFDYFLFSSTWIAVVGGIYLMHQKGC